MRFNALERKKPPRFPWAAPLRDLYDEILRERSSPSGVTGAIVETAKGKRVPGPGPFHGPGPQGRMRWLFSDSHGHCSFRVATETI